MFEAAMWNPYKSMSWLFNVLASRAHFLEPLLDLLGYFIPLLSKGGSSASGALSFVGKDMELNFD